MISHKHCCIFIHIPKCGGTSLEQVIWPEPRQEADLWMGFVDKYHNKYQTGGLQHLFARQVLQEVGEQTFRSYFKFSIIRNPWDKAVSQFIYMQQRDDLREFIGLKKSDSFKIYLEKIKRKTHVQWEKQYRFILNDHGELMVDFLGRFENIRQDSDYIFSSLNIRANLPHVNATLHKRYSSYYDTETVEMIAEFYAEDIHLFNYKFEDHKDVSK
jgi:hypothetical protein